MKRGKVYRISEIFYCRICVFSNDKLFDFKWLLTFNSQAVWISFFCWLLWTLDEKLRTVCTINCNFICSSDIRNELKNNWSLKIRSFNPFEYFLLEINYCVFEFSILHFDLYDIICFYFSFKVLVITISLRRY